MSTTLLAHLRGKLDAGRKLLVPYLMAGVPDRGGFLKAFDAIAEHADAVEIGIPFSDPLMDGPVIAAAGERALRAGIGPARALELAAELPDAAPRVVMTYYNPIHRIGEVEFCRRLSEAGVVGLIVPDLPLEESQSLRDAVDAAGLGWVPLVAPTSSRERVERIAATATGFVYAVSTLGVTGARAALSDRATGVVAACRAATDLPVLVGIGVSDAQQAAEASRTADGVIVGSALTKLLTEATLSEAAAFIADLRDALDTST